MNCERANQIDLEEFLLEREEPRWEEFRNHYPGCEDCSREVAQWSKLEALLQTAAATDAHPSEETLLGLTMLSLASGERASVEAHLEGCAPCRSEVATLRSFDFSAVQRTAAPEASRPTLIERSVTSLAEWRESLSWGSLQPALMAAAVVLLAIPFGLRLWEQEDVSGQGPSANIEVAAETAVPERADPADDLELVPSPDMPEQDLHVAEISPTAAPEAGISAEASALPETSTGSVELAANEADSEPPLTESSPEPALIMPEGEVMLIAALLPGDLPIYGADSLMGFGGAAVRTGGFVRSTGLAGASVEILSPEHVGWTSRATPTLYWRLSALSKLPVEIVITDDVSPEPLLEIRLEGPHRSGIHSVSLAGQGVELAPDTTYRWSVSLIVDDDRRSKDRFASSALLYRPADSASAADLAAAAPGHIAHQYAAKGYWYDAFDQLTLWLEAEPRDARLLEHRAALLEQVGLGSEPASE